LLNIKGIHKRTTTKNVPTDRIRWY